MGLAGQTSQSYSSVFPTCAMALGVIPLRTKLGEGPGPVMVWVFQAPV